MFNFFVQKTKVKGYIRKAKRTIEKRLKVKLILIFLKVNFLSSSFRTNFTWYLEKQTAYARPWSTSQNAIKEKNSRKEKLTTRLYPALNAKRFTYLQLVKFLLEFPLENCWPFPLLAESDICIENNQLLLWILALSLFPRQQREGLMETVVLVKVENLLIFTPLISIVKEFTF